MLQEVLKMKNKMITRSLSSAEASDCATGGFESEKET